jgi:tetratricopeptide (TPR) repeat protein
MSTTPASASSRRANALWLLGIGGLLIAGVVMLIARSGSQPNPEPHPAPDPSPVAFPIPRVASSPYLNTGPDAHYVGSETCRGCHEDRHTTFRRTGMGRSMAAVDLDREPADAKYEHPPSKRRYEIARRDGRLWHREFLFAPGTEDVLLAEYPMTYVVGSGRHSLTYVCDAEGFLVESPATWYTSKKAWAMSPGYDRPEQRGFERAIGVDCLLCHAGRAEAVDDTHHRMKIIEPAIGCERCHGPGSLHTDRQRQRAKAGGQPTGESDLTIVNPRDLPRDLAEAVCQQCHLRPTALVPARGRTQTAYRPGLPLEDFVHTYQLDEENAAMTVVGHVEQLHLSKCYQNSKTLTCVTCHDPHGMPREEERLGYYRAACLKCHQASECKVEPAHRAKESPENDCAKCHMPRSPTDIPHLAFSHHRIGIHDQKKTAAPAPTGPVGTLRPFLPVSPRVGEIDRQRSLGLAYLEAGNREKDPQRAQVQLERGLHQLSAVRAAGLKDPAVEVGIARIRYDLGIGGVLEHADAALGMPGLVGQERCMALFFKGDDHAAAGRYAEALPVLRELTRLRRNHSEWLLIADCERELGNRQAMIAALEMAVRIEPRQWKAHQALAEHYAASDPAKAEYHRKRAVP